MQQGFVPKNLASAVVHEEYFNVGYRLLELTVGQRRGLAPDLAGVQGRRLTVALSRRRIGAGRGRVCGRCSPCPASAWLCLFFLAPLYVVLAIVFGAVDPMFRTPVPVWNPLRLERHASSATCSTTSSAPTASSGPALLRTAVYVLLASVLCVRDRVPGRVLRRRGWPGGASGLILALLIAPFWISYMMRMLAWVNLLADDGLVNKALGLGHLRRAHRLAVRARHRRRAGPGLRLRAVHDPAAVRGAGPAAAGRCSRRRATSAPTGCRRSSGSSLPMCRSTIVAAVLLTCLPMLGDYFTNDLLSGSPQTAMVGNLINETVLTPGRDRLRRRVRDDRARGLAAADVLLRPRRSRPPSRVAT